MKTYEMIVGIFKAIAKGQAALKPIEKEIQRYNRADTVNMTLDEMNRFRHIAASAYYVSRGYPESGIWFLGHAKEFYDIIRDIDWNDRNFDIKNNETGRRIGQKFKYQNLKYIFDYIFATEIYPRRKK